ncbi:3-carboxy-cis,cis-muconate cycloisomerase [Mesorhizobium sp. NBSH29]|uniref:3-carboxy-cis,cis-muconate cycloisomerase n=1 Tax=Mesorhizobium sp. NBSH29 TaxID=2654249 RepID=UPI0018967DAF|nr:3-carboxy-cis,cis-muconate cycloisomerase [Mesorhizobium sp. NBSH29]QPC88467.1 3-carboxy-cis,cis-muconate cycloisomerase [Mesorhizobium sp. NBSH29]
MMVTAFDHPVLSSLLVDPEVERLFGFEAELSAMLSFERALAKVQAAHGLISSDAAAAIAKACSAFQPDISALRASTQRDGVIVPGLISQLRAGLDESLAGYVHFGATSQDVIDTALMFRLKPLLAHFGTRLEALETQLSDLSTRFGENSLMGHTRMQPALDITVADRIDSWRAPLHRHRARLASLASSLLVVQLGGAVGTLDQLGGKAKAIRASLASELSLGDAPQWHSQRDHIADLSHWLSLVTGTLGKLGLDIALMAQAGSEIALSGGGGSSAMPHKRNPVAAETMISLARFNAVQVSAMHHALVHEQERSGAAWTLEWLTLPQMLAATGAALRHAGNLLSSISQLGQR